ncbi:MAG: twin-arginine translocase TatA/TatE family subunit [Chloroflexi bacterium]|nr:MAG: twin-arginine translocase TatA/TatE family subunit [Chloroflexota bacterium]PIE80357.1 MAG: twin-arginine translocase TatA/TatE family subunit [Chloroflexota bacterium]
MPTLGPWEWGIILIIIVIIFGVGRISKLGSEMGKGIRAFREGLQEIQDQEEKEDEAAAEEFKKNNRHKS